MPLRGVCGGGRDGASNAGLDCSLTLPAGCQPGDLVLFITSANLGAPTADVDGATIVHGPDTAQSNNKAYVCSLVLDAAAISAGTIPITWSSTGRTIASGIVLRDVDPDSLVITYADALTTDIPTVTTPQDGSDVVLLAASRTASGGAAVSTYPTGYTKATDAKTTFASGVNTANSIALLDTPGPEGAYGGGSISYAPAPTSSHTYAVAIAPAVVAPNQGTAQASWTAAATAEGAAPAVPVPAATATATWAAAAAAQGDAPVVPVPTATAATTWGAAATAAGSAPTPGVNAGTATTTWTALPAAEGAAPEISVPTAAADTTWAAAATATGHAPNVPVPQATAATSWTATASTAGRAPAVPIPQAVGVAVWAAIATATGRAPTIAANAGTAATAWAADAAAQGSQPGPPPDWPDHTTLTPIVQTRSLEPLPVDRTLTPLPEPRTLEAIRD